ncbi:MAG: inositol monophosphatase [Phycisphaerae bacterium]|nr:inositol monophosphatase [Phycisphaerae bacterium]
MLLNRQAILDRLLALQQLILQQIIDSRQRQQLHAVARETSADTIYAIDALVESTIEEFCDDWSRTLPLVLIAEGLELGGKVFPEGSEESDAVIRLIIDPIDGTRGLMYDKRSAWTLAGVAPNRGPHTRLRDIEIAAMTELPTSKMAYADVLWAIHQGGARGKRITIGEKRESDLSLAPSTADTLDHGFASVSSFFPGTKVLAADLLEEIVRGVLGRADVRQAAVFDDQYICTGGQFYELIVGHDRFIADVRPQLYQILRQPMGLCCHPYDCCTALIAEEAGVMLTDGWGGKLDGPLDCTTPMSWIGYANSTLRVAVEPLILRFMHSRQVNTI